MADVNLRNSTVSGRSIALTDHVFGADRSNSDAAAAWKSDTLSEVIRTILRNPTSNLTAGEKTAFRTAIGAGTSNFGGSYNDLTSRPTLFSGSYNDLTNKPTSSGGRTKVLLVTSGTLPTAPASSSTRLITSWTISTQGTSLGIQTHSSEANAVFIPNLMTDVYHLVAESEVNGTVYDRLVMNVGPYPYSNQSTLLRFNNDSYRSLRFEPDTGDEPHKDTIDIAGSGSRGGTLPANSRVKLYALQD